MSEYPVDGFPTRRDGPESRAARLARWFRPQEFQERARRRDRAADDAQLIGDIKWQWRQACEQSGLGRMIYTPSGPTMSFPLIGRVDLGPPVTFTVRREHGQLLADFEAAAPRVAVAMGVAGIRVRPLAADWIVIELLDAPTTPALAAVPGVIPIAPRHGTAHEARGLAAAA